MTITKCVDYAGALIFKCLINRFHCSYTVCIHRMKMIVSIETMVVLGFHVLSGHYYSPAFAGTVCISFIFT